MFEEGKGPVLVGGPYSPVEEYDFVYSFDLEIRRLAWLFEVEI